jgi:anti-sigma regulatory factor (Ser/Thr protein kinase)
MPWNHSLDDDRQLSVTGDDDGSVLLMAVRGSLARTLLLRARTMVHKCLADNPAGLIVDLTELDDPAGASAPLWLTARQTGEAMQPPVRLLLCLEPDTVLADRLHRLGARWFLPIFASVAQARTVLAGTPVLTDRSQLRLPPKPMSASMARMLVADACRAWALPHLLGAGQLVASELVTNAVAHARTELLVTVARRGCGLYLAVCDGNPNRPPRVAPTSAGAEGIDEHGRGLWIVQQVTSAWGAVPTHDGAGKVVWASVQPRSPWRPDVAVERHQRTR